LLNSKELLEKTGISRATLNNYISWGIVPKPEVLPPEPQDGAAPRIGYFPDEVADRIAEIQRLKREGWSITRIAEHFGGRENVPSAGEPPRRSLGSAPAIPDRAVRLPGLSIDEQAYMVNQRFELVWFNAAAVAGVLRDLPLPGTDGASRNVFKFLLRSAHAEPNIREQLLRFHLGLAKQHGSSLSDVCRELSQEDTSTLRRLYEEVKAPGSGLVSQAVLASGTFGIQPLCVYGVQLRDGTLILYVPVARPAVEPSSATQGLREIAGEQAAASVQPRLSRAAVLAADLQHPNRIWSELPAEEYFELINQIWLTVEPIFRRHHGTHGKHHRDGLVCYFFPQPDGSHVLNALLAALEMREAMRRVSKAWQLRKGWATELYMNTGVDEGPQWLGTLKSPPQAEFTMLGDTLNHAVRISDFASYGAIWVTKNLIGKLAPDQKQRVKYGVRRKSNDGREIFVSSIFSNVDSLTEVSAGAAEKLKSIARLPITEVVEIAAADRRRDLPAGAVPPA
jgi:adenylate cyclase